MHTDKDAEADIGQREQENRQAGRHRTERVKQAGRQVDRQSQRQSSKQKDRLTVK